MTKEIEEEMNKRGGRLCISSAGSHLVLPITKGLPQIIYLHQDVHCNKAEEESLSPLSIV